MEVPSFFAKADAPRASVDALAKERYKSRIERRLWDRGLKPQARQQEGTKRGDPSPFKPKKQERLIDVRLEEEPDDAEDFFQSKGNRRITFPGVIYVRKELDIINQLISTHKKGFESSHQRHYADPDNENSFCSHLYLEKLREENKEMAASCNSHPAHAPVRQCQLCLEMGTNSRKDNGELTGILGVRESGSFNARHARVQSPKRVTAVSRTTSGSAGR